MSNVIKSIRKIVENNDKEKEVSVKEKVPVNEELSTAISPIDTTATRSLIDVVKDGAFSGLNEEQRQSATFRTGTVLGASVFELGKAFDNKIDQGESYKRGATGLIGLFEIAFSAKRVLDGLQHHDRLLNSNKSEDDGIVEEPDNE